ncbi:hypothetical protein Taro_041434 [Colocasia esculenta]|uniref:RNase H type-1 domain-containing protein n=1 Tax=Colocasia esculenta TaxID=4460 RepID=A0A843WXA9_COLES|nr:hypothetical protein [Colocasia esculenta]
MERRQSGLPTRAQATLEILMEILMEITLRLLNNGPNGLRNEPCEGGPRKHVYHSRRPGSVSLTRCQRQWMLSFTWDPRQVNKRSNKPYWAMNHMEMAHDIVTQNSRWILGNGDRIRFLDDVWIGQRPLRNNLQTPLYGPSPSIQEVLLDVSHLLHSLIAADLDHLQLSTTVDLWKTRCKMKFEQVHTSLTSIRYNIQECLSIAIGRMGFKYNSSSQQMDAIRDLGLFVIVPVKMSKFVRWIPLVHGLMLNVDGASKGNPGPCGGGGIFRDSSGNATLDFSHYYGVGSCMVSEVRALHDGILLAIEKGIMVTAICSDSLSLWVDRLGEWLYFILLGWSTLD